MPPKRKQRVPRALHDELQDYASLLRALDTGDELGVARKIARAEPPKKRRKLTHNADGDDRGEGSSSIAPPKSRVRKRDGWTRWPLLVRDTIVPTFGLEEEIAVLARQCLRLQNADSLPNPDEQDPDSDSASMPAIASSASAFLSSTLALLAHHTPARPQSMQDRLNPLKWQDVLEIVAACGDADATMISNVKTRLEAIYGVFETNAIDRLGARKLVMPRAQAALIKADEALLLPPACGTSSDARPLNPRDAAAYWDSADEEDEDQLGPSRRPTTSYSASPPASSVPPPSSSSLPAVETQTEAEDENVEIASALHDEELEPDDKQQLEDDSDGDPIELTDADADLDDPNAPITSFQRRRIAIPLPASEDDDGDSSYSSSEESDAVPDVSRTQMQSRGRRGANTGGSVYVMPVGYSAGIEPGELMPSGEAEEADGERRNGISIPGRGRPRTVKFRAPVKTRTPRESVKVGPVDSGGEEDEEEDDDEPGNGEEKDEDDPGGLAEPEVQGQEAEEEEDPDDAEYSDSDLDG
ncbi:hypothetical protein HMN09_00289200 [Mycena chlorophos]|uniref:Uncharacterized protein n=1 Tax=Mycena chlorophos TaxID=658473 RepID=A0A8H6WJ47_MYCCL|nr:hypothetical protein HMN09_00289200 [Mycena chlorophos]